MAPNDVAYGKSNFDQQTIAILRDPANDHQLDSAPAPTFVLLSLITEQLIQSWRLICSTQVDWQMINPASAPNFIRPT